MIAFVKFWARPAPEHYVYELFLDDIGQKISKSKGNGLTIDEWLTYADPNSLAQFMYNKPREAKKLYFDVIPRAVDEYAQQLAAYPKQTEAKDQLMNPVWHIHAGNPPPPESGGVTFALLLNLAAVANTEDKSVMWAFLQRYMPDMSPEHTPTSRFTRGLCHSLLQRLRRHSEKISSAYG